jgi:hypothetical protein
MPALQAFRKYVGRLALVCCALVGMYLLPKQMIGHYENRDNSSQWIVFKGGKAHIYTPANASRTRFNEEIVDYERDENRVTLFTATGARVFVIQSSMLLIDSHGTAWDRKYNND